MSFLLFVAAHTIQTITNEPCLSRAGRITAGAGFLVGRGAICVGTGWTFKGTKAGFRRTTIAVVLSIPRVEVHINPSPHPPRVCPTPSTPASRWGIWFRTINICSCSIFLFIIPFCIPFMLWIAIMGVSAFRKFAERRLWVWVFGFLFLAILCENMCITF